jgi:hypothetical protein
MKELITHELYLRAEVQRLQGNPLTRSPIRRKIFTNKYTTYIATLVTRSHLLKYQAKYIDELKFQPKILTLA